MGAFSDIEIEWAGQAYTIRADEVMRVIARIEEVITLPELHRATETGAVPIAKVASAFATILRFKGAPVSDGEVYNGMFADGDLTQRVHTAIGVLYQIMMPPSAIERLQHAAGWQEKKTRTLADRKKS